MPWEAIVGFKVTKATNIEKQRNNQKWDFGRERGTEKKAVGHPGLSVSTGHDSLNYSVEAATGSGCHQCDGVTLETVLPNSCPPSANCGRHGNQCHC